MFGARRRREKSSTAQAAQAAVGELAIHGIKLTGNSSGAKVGANIGPAAFVPIVDVSTPDYDEFGDSKRMPFVLGV